jgi:hypothetical protein
LSQQQASLDYKQLFGELLMSNVYDKKAIAHSARFESVSFVARGYLENTSSVQCLILNEQDGHLISGSDDSTIEVWHVQALLHQKTLV